MSDSAPQLTAGTVIGQKYETLHQIGRGGMGEVWAAKHLDLPKHFAIKILHTRGEPLSADALARFKREAEIACRLKHPNIVDVNDIGTLPSGDPYLVLELLEGEPLSRRLKRGPMGVEEARSVIRQAGSALQAAHHMGVVHRDLKPDNIFLLPSPLGGLRVKVLDFGISKIQDSHTVQTQEAVLVGTPQYMSPEQATGSNKDVGPQSDVFALGSIAYEMLSGGAAFTGESVAQLVFRVAYEKHQPLASKVSADIPATMVAAVERALLKDRAHRTADVATFVVEFTGEPITLTPTAGLTPAPQLAVVATPSMNMSASLGMADTAAPTPISHSPVRAPTPGVPTGPATPQAPTAPSLPPPPSSSSASVAPQVLSTSTTGPRRFNFAWVGIAATVVVASAVSFKMFGSDIEPSAMAGAESKPARSVAGRPPDPPEVVAVQPPPPPAPPPVPEAEGQPAKTEPKVAAVKKNHGAMDEKPAAVAQTREADEPRPASAKTLAAATDAVPEPSSPPMNPTPIKRTTRKDLTPQEKTLIKDMEAAARSDGQTQPDVRELTKLWERSTSEVTSIRAMDLLTAEVAKAMCAQKHEKYYIWRDKIQTVGVKRKVKEACRD